MNSQDGISRRHLLGTTMAGALGAQGQQAGGKRPNLVFLFSDQQSHDMLGCYGNRQIETPHIDQLAKESVRFNRCISNSPVCTPYRGLLLTGQHPMWSGALANDLQIVPGKGKYFAEKLRDAGYRTGYYGKWHLYGGDRVRPIPAGPYRYGFDGEFLSNNCTLLFDKDRSYYWDAEGKKQLYGDWEPYGQTRQAMEFLDKQKDGEPFAMFVSWHPPHSWQGAESYPAPPELMAKYDPAKIQLRGNCADTPERRKAYQGYMAMCTSIDTCVGWLMKKVQEKGLAENTIFIFTSDHGDLLMSHGLPGNKGRVENESMHVPLLVRWPKRLKARVSEMPIGAMDLMPTLLSMMGIEPPDTCHGQNLAPAILQGRDRKIDSLPLFLMVHDWRGLYTDRYSYSFAVETQNPSWWNQNAGRTPDSHNRLFDREADPLEMNNLYHKAEHRKLRERLHEESLAWMKKFRDTGLSYADIMSRVEREEDLALDKQRMLTRKGEGKLKGRPVDLL